MAGVRPAVCNKIVIISKALLQFTQRQHLTNMKSLYLYILIILLSLLSICGYSQALSDSIKSQLQEVIVSASRTAQARREAPVAIAVISQQTIQETKASRLDYLMNKVSGVFMVNLGNEQHEMSIRQPMTTRSLFLYLEDGVPIRTTGIYNHNALLEMNMTAARQIEVIKGPASSLYGAEAIGGAVNIITQAPPPGPLGILSVQGSNNGYKRVDVQTGTTSGKWGVLLSGYYANRNNGPVDQTNYHKTALTLRADYRIDDKTSWSNSVTYVDYYSDMGGGSLDSAHFAQKNYSTLYSFNYRTVNALRIRSQLSHEWNKNSSTQLTLAFRNNSVKQNPSYYITNNYSNPLLANGQVNNSSFNSYMMIAQHVQKINWLDSRLIIGVSTDISPSTYVAQYIKVNRNNTGKYINYTGTDSALSNYSTGIDNLASYMNYELSPLKGLKVVAALRYDFYHYNFRNALPPSASTGAPSTTNDFNRLTPKLGFTYNYRRTGFYANYSQGYVPPQVTELFNSVKVPYLQPQTFFNYEVGGWVSMLKNKLYLDYSLYLLNGTNEIISVQQNDGSYVNQNAGKTRHKGIEYGITYKPSNEWTFRISATNALHTFIYDVEKSTGGSQANYSGHEMAAAPHFIANAEVTYRPAFWKGFRIGIEWQHQGSYYMDNANSKKYPGSDVFNVRAGYTVGRLECWVNALNTLNKYYAVLASKSTYGYTYNMGDPRELTAGISYHFGK
jgi:iron complex outermembrane recepter protein